MPTCLNAAKDVQVLRDLAKRYREVCAQPRQEERRRLWRQHNSLRLTRPLLYMRVFACWHEMPESELVCEDPFFRQHENALRSQLFQDSLQDDTICEPWVTQAAVFVSQGDSLWGPAYGRTHSGQQGGAWKYDPPLKELDDVSKLIMPAHRIDEAETERRVDRLQEAVGDILTVNVDRAPQYRGFNGDISTHLAYLRGLEQLMWDMTDNAEWLHGLLAHMRDGILKTHRGAEAAGDWRLCDHGNQAMPYAEGLADPQANSAPVTRDQLWCFMAAQEFALISPEMHDEFLLQYQRPIMAAFGLVAYGCCEDLTHKIDMLRQIPNLRRIAVTPWADLKRCAEQIGTDYVISWRPSPAEMVCTGWDPERVRRVVKDAVETCDGLHMDITLKDVQTVEKNPARLRAFVRIVRDVVGA